MDSNPLTTAIREKLLTGTLPRDKCRITWFGPGTGQVCAACERRIAAPEVECECEVSDTQAIFLHRQCFEVWDQLREDEPGFASKS